MTEVRLRDLGSVAPGRRRRQPDRDEPSPEAVAPTLSLHPAPSAADVLVTPPPAATPPRAIFGDAKPDALDAPEIDDALAPLAELAAHRATQGPLCIGLVGGPGAGKSFALARLSRRVLDLAAAGALAQRAGAETPFLPAVHVQSIDAAGLPESDSVAHALAVRLLAGLRTRAPTLARDIDDAARDPQVALRDTNDRLDELRRRLDTEHRALDDAGARRARLVESTLYDASGSQIDAYARANGALIESRLNGFGFRGEAIRTYKTLVQLAIKPAAKTGLGLRALFAFRGQTKLIGAALVFVAAGIGLGAAIDQQPAWTDSLRAGPKFGPWLADWFGAHAGLLPALQTAAFALAALAFLANVMRALRFLQPILKGARLLDGDLEHRRHDLDGLYAHQTKRVDTLQREVDQLTRDVTALEKRVEGAGADMDHASSHADLTGDAAQAERVFAAINATIATAGAGSPQRIVVALDHLDAIAPARARALLDALHRMSGPAILTLAGFDPGRLDPDALHRPDLGRWVQVPCRLDGPTIAAGSGRWMRDALGHGAGRPARPPLDARRSALDDPFDENEADLLASLTDLAGRTPRAVRRFASLYTLARIGDMPHRGLLAVMLALTAGGTQEERRLVASALAGDPDLPFDPPQAPPRLSAAFAEAIGPRRVARGEAAAMLRRASMFSLATPSIG